MRHEHEKERKIAAIEALLARQARRNRIALATLTVLAAFTLALLLAHLSGIEGLSHNP
jgi:hypothetical protein